MSKVKDYLLYAIAAATFGRLFYIQDVPLCMLVCGLLGAVLINWEESDG